MNQLFTLLIYKIYLPKNINRLVIRSYTLSVQTAFLAVCPNKRFTAQKPSYRTLICNGVGLGPKVDLKATVFLHTIL